MQIVKENIEHYTIKSDAYYKPTYEVVVEKTEDGKVIKITIKEYYGVKLKSETVITKEILEVLKVLSENKIITI